MGKSGKTADKSGKIWETLGNSGKICENVGKSKKIWEDLSNFLLDFMSFKHRISPKKRCELVRFWRLDLDPASSMGRWTATMRIYIFCHGIRWVNTCGAGKQVIYGETETVREDVQMGGTLWL